MLLVNSNSVVQLYAYGTNSHTIRVYGCTICVYAYGMYHMCTVCNTRMVHNNYIMNLNGFTQGVHINE